MSIVVVFGFIYFSSCSSESVAVQTPTGYRVYGKAPEFGSLDGIYKPVEDKHDWFVNEKNSRYVIKKIAYDWSGSDYEGPGWIFLIDNSYFPFRNLSDSEYPPESNWTCGVGVDKEFYIEKLYD